MTLSLQHITAGLRALPVRGAGRARLGLLVAIPALLAAGCGSSGHTGITAPILGANSGQVRAEVTSNGQPLSGVAVTLTGGDLSSPQTLATDAGGVAAFQNLPDGNYTVAISGFDANQTTFAQTSAPATISDSVGLVTVQFQGVGPGAASVSGVVTVNGQAPAQLAGQTVTVTLFPLSGAPVTGNLTGSTGEFAFNGLVPGTYTLQVAVGSDVRTTTVTVAQGQQLAVSLEFANLPGVTPVPAGTPTGQVRAEVTVAGQPISGVTVTLGDGFQRTAATGADGVALFSSLPNGTYTVTISGFDTSRLLFTQTSSQVTLSDTIGLVTAQFQGAETPTAVLTGFVTINGAAPAAIPDQGVSITLVPAVGAPLTGDLAGTTGEYTFTQLPAGTQTVRVSVGGEVRSTTVTLAQGERRELNLEFGSLTPVP